MICGLENENTSSPLQIFTSEIEEILYNLKEMGI